MQLHRARSRPVARSTAWRLLSDPMSRSLGKAVVIDNRGGAGIEPQ